MNISTPKLTDDFVPTRVAGVVEAEVDGARVLLSPADFTYLGLEGSGAAIWDLIDGERSFGVVVDLLQQRFGAQPELIRRETEDFLLGLIAAGALQPPQ